MMALVFDIDAARNMDIRSEMDIWAKQWRSSMLRFARLHLSSLDDAEDVVQESFAAALVADLATLSVVEPRRYLFGILRNKVMDRLRHRYRNDREFSRPYEDDLDGLLFDGRDHWLSGIAPAAWHSPDSSMESEQFFKVIDVCVNNLPVKPARVFSMKELLDCDSKEICEALGISKTDYWQCMSRARKQIHLCLNQHWFGGETI